MLCVCHYYYFSSIIKTFPICIQSYSIRRHIYRNELSNVTKMKFYTCYEIWINYNLFFRRILHNIFFASFILLSLISCLPSVVVQSAAEQKIHDTQSAHRERIDGWKSTSREMNPIKVICKTVRRTKTGHTHQNYWVTRSLDTSAVGRQCAQGRQAALYRSLKCFK